MQVQIRSLGGPEDWSVRVTNPANGRQCCVFDTGGTYDIARTLEGYEATGSALAVYPDYRSAMERAYQEVR